MISLRHTSGAPNKLLFHLGYYAQVRIPISEVPGVVRALVDSQTSWEEVAAKYPAQKQTEGAEQ
jgi:hypothetical protein